MYAAVLVPLDDSPSAREALRVAAELVDPDTGRLILLNVQEPVIADDVLGHASGAPPADAEARAQEAGAAVLRRALQETGLPAERTEQVVHAGRRPAEVVVETAGELGVDAIVMGSSGASDIASLTLGSVSHRVLHTARCRVILVR